MASITSLTNPRVKQLVRLQRDAAERRRLGQFCVEDLRDLGRALDGGFRVKEIFLCPQSMDGEAPPLGRALQGGAVLTEITEPVLCKIAYRERPSGFVALLEGKPRRLTDLAPIRGGLSLVVSGLEKPGNLGAILRCADACGAAAVLADQPAPDLFNPNCIRASTGAVFHVPWAGADRKELALWLKQQGLLILAATPQAKTPYTAVDLRGPLVIVLGAESTGLDPFWVEAADRSIGIPMRGKSDSLNVSVAAAILLFEAVRQRSE